MVSMNAADCPLCGSSLAESAEEWMVPVKGGRARYFHCSYCDLVFLDPGLRPTAAEERDRYLEHNNSPADEGYVRYLRGFAEEALLPYVGPPAKVLDFGSGPVPVFSQLMGELGFSVDIYDAVFAPDVQWQENRYDAVTAVEVVEHLFEPMAEFRRIMKVVQPGGFLVLRTLLHYSDKERFAGWWYRQDPTHVSFYSPRSFEFLAAFLDFELVDIKKGRSVILRRS